MLHAGLNLWQKGVKPKGREREHDTATEYVKCEEEGSCINVSSLCGTCGRREKESRLRLLLRFGDGRLASAELTGLSAAADVAASASRREAREQQGALKELRSQRR